MNNEEMMQQRTLRAKWTHNKPPDGYKTGWLVQVAGPVRLDNAQELALFVEEKSGKIEWVPLDELRIQLGE